MSIISQTRAGIARVIALEGEAIELERAAYIDNGRGALIDSGAPPAVTSIFARIQTQSAAIWRAESAESGLELNTAPYILAAYNADLLMNDIVRWQGRRYRVGAVTRPTVCGEAACVQAPLCEVLD